MRSFWALLRILLINYFGISTIRFKADKKKFLKKLLVAFLIIVGIGPTVALYTNLLIKGFDLLAPLGQEGAILTFGLVLVSSIIFFFGIFYVISFFYLAADAQSMLSLPLRGWQVLGARFSLILGYEYLTELPFLLPPLLVYGIKSEASVIYWVLALFGYLLTPLLPLSLATIPTVVVMRFANLSRRKDLFKVLGSLVVIVIAISYQFFFQKSGLQNMDPVFLQNLLSSRNGLMSLMSRIFPSTGYLGLALVGADSLTGLFKLIQFTGISLLAVALAWAVGERLYFQGLVGSAETTVRRKRLNNADYQRLSRSLPGWLSYFYKEVRLLLRNPNYFINSVMTNLLVPVLVAVPLIIQSHNQQGPVPWEGLAGNPEIQTILLAVITALVMFLAGTNAIAATSLSREGKQFFISKYIPLAYAGQILAKLLSAGIFSVIGVVFLVLVARIIIPVSMTLTMVLLIVGLASIVPVIEAGLVIDLARPKLEWENEAQAVKQNLNGVFSMLFTLLLGGIILYPVIRFVHTPLPAAGLMLIYFSLAALVLYYFLMNWGIKRYNRLEG